MSSAGIPITPRSWQPREMLMVSEFLAKNYKGRNWQTRVRLGTPASALPAGELSDAERKMLQVYARWADAIIFDSKTITIIEAKIKPQLGPLEALIVYKNLFLSDPAYAEHHKKRIDLQFLYAVEDPVEVNLARQLGITPIQYRPNWLSEYFDILSARERRAPRSV